MRRSVRLAVFLAATLFCGASQSSVAHSQKDAAGAASSAFSWTWSKFTDGTFPNNKSDFLLIMRDTGFEEEGAKGVFHVSDSKGNFFAQFDSESKAISLSYYSRGTTRVPDAVITSLAALATNVGVSLFPDEVRYTTPIKEPFVRGEVSVAISLETGAWASTTARLWRKQPPSKP